MYDCVFIYIFLYCVYICISVPLVYMVYENKVLFCSELSFSDGPSGPFHEPSGPGPSGPRAEMSPIPQLGISPTCFCLF